MFSRWGGPADRRARRWRWQRASEARAFSRLELEAQVEGWWREGARRGWIYGPAASGKSSALLRWLEAQPELDVVYAPCGRTLGFDPKRDLLAVLYGGLEPHLGWPRFPRDPAPTQVEVEVALLLEEGRDDEPLLVVVDGEPSIQWMDRPLGPNVRLLALSRRPPPPCDEVVVELASGSNDLLLRELVSRARAEGASIPDERWSSYLQARPLEGARGSVLALLAGAGGPLDRESLESLTRLSQLEALREELARPDGWARMDADGYELRHSALALRLSDSSVRRAAKQLASLSATSSRHALSFGEPDLSREREAAWREEGRGAWGFGFDALAVFDRQRGKLRSARSREAAAEAAVGSLHAILVAASVAERVARTQEKAPPGVDEHRHRSIERPAPSDAVLGDDAEQVAFMPALSVSAPQRRAILDLAEARAGSREVMRSLVLGGRHRMADKALSELAGCTDPRERLQGLDVVPYLPASRRRDALERELKALLPRLDAGGILALADAVRRYPSKLQQLVTAKVLDRLTAPIQVAFLARLGHPEVVLSWLGPAGPQWWAPPSASAPRSWAPWPNLLDALPCSSRAFRSCCSGAVERGRHAGGRESTCA